MIAFEIIIDVDLPIAIDRVIAALGEVKPLHRTTEFCGLPRYVAPDFVERGRTRVLVHEDERTPGLDSKLGQADLGTVPILDALKLGRAEQFAIQLVGP